VLSLQVLVCTIPWCIRSRILPARGGGGVNYASNDRHCMDGQRLMVISGSYGGDGAG
jgi:hypothetical protein